MKVLLHFSSSFAFIIDTISTILSIAGFIFNAAALAAFMKDEKRFGFPIRYGFVLTSLST